MSKFKAWISAARLRTLPLSVSGIMVGSAYALLNDYFNFSIFILAIATTLVLQILSNFANDYGDGVKGTDNQDRVGPMRALQSGNISDKQMKLAIILSSFVAFALAVGLIYVSFGSENLLYTLAFIALGLLAIYAAIKYTVGNSAYGYRGLGDLFVFLFFGLVSVIGTYFLFSQKLDSLIILPAVGVGLLSTAVLNVNNMRDQESDLKAGKNTLVVKLGNAKAKLYHFSIIVIAFASFVTYVYLLNNSIQYVCLIGFIPLFIHLLKVRKNKNPKLLDPELKKVALSTFAIALLHIIVSVAF
ncbi:1,4-dihydroxy-2-naphthoate octaprenyltransferase [Psychroflexus planctonicus]|uniref:1,4-dihydroxy-2-naphthoate octaprenyltransferase n=1 Tax=Psychroflexus planctonicus TaxID=1526575 RepID=A0ABQ1SND5_9FLAO|nr:1,4-dihydroxy-2-naphthoate octaprenyltransferase [Psychroflexus planctonicus]GGE43234.1 1,4-dihydroxy-2-naphthoate octaprenyltransferase [Psychroflexus planctonicus]